MSVMLILVDVSLCFKPMVVPTPGVVIPQLGAPGGIAVGGIAAIGTPGVVIPQLSRPLVAGNLLCC